MFPWSEEDQLEIMLKPVPQEWVPQTKLDDGISNSDNSLEQHREQSTNMIHRFPVEILSMIFVFVKEAVLFSFQFEEPDDPDHLIPDPLYTQPCQSPPLLVGAVCRRWRDITLATPRLWTDLIVDLYKSEEGQFCMIDEWARRSRTYPLDMVMYGGDLSDESRFDDLFSLLRSLAVRWNNVALAVPPSVSDYFFETLQEFGPINSLFISRAAARVGEMDTLCLQHPLRPRHLITHDTKLEAIPFQWDNLVFLEIANVYDWNIAPDIVPLICQAHNLTHCMIGVVSFHSRRLYHYESSDFIVSNSLIHLRTNLHIFDHLILPSLQSLDFGLNEDFDETFDVLAEFIKRSGVSLNQFRLRCQCQYDVGNPFPPFEKLPGITSLHINTSCAFRNVKQPERDEHMDAFLQSIQPTTGQILPRLDSLLLGALHLSPLSWALLSHFFPYDAQDSLMEPAVEKLIATTSPNHEKLFSQFEIRITDSTEERMSSYARLRLLLAERSDMGCVTWGHFDGDSLCYKARPSSARPRIFYFDTIEAETAFLQSRRS